MGTLFANGLQDQCNEVKIYIENILSVKSTTWFRFVSSTNSSKQSLGDNKVVLNVVGLSRGGIAAIQLAKTLAHIPPERLQINLMLFDPVPGNLITSSKLLDPLSLNTANSSLDLRDCHNLNDVLALYPFRPLPDFAFHAPVLPEYPVHCKVEEDAVLGCHQGALFCQSKSIESRLSFFRIHEWLTVHKTNLFPIARDESAARTDFNFTATSLGARLFMTPLDCKTLMDEVMKPPNNDVERIIRHAHSSPPGAMIILNSLPKSDFVGAPSSVLYLNKYHQQLSERLNESDKLPKNVECQIKLFLEVYRPSRKRSSALFSSLLSCTNDTD